MFGIGPDPVCSVSIPRCNDIPQLQSQHSLWQIGVFTWYILTCIGRYTRWPEAFSITNNRSTDSHSGIHFWLDCLFWSANHNHHWQRQSVKSTLWQYLNYTLGANRILTTAYHPCSNGLVERHRHLKAALKAYPQPHKWTETLPLVLFGIYILLYSKTSSVQLRSWYMVLHCDYQGNFSLLLVVLILSISHIMLIVWSLSCLNYVLHPHVLQLQGKCICTELSLIVHMYLSE